MKPEIECIIYASTSLIDGFNDIDSNAISSKYSIYMLANTGDNDESEGIPFYRQYTSDPISR